MKKGISLIVLVITIIVMIILAASVVITLSNTGIINKAGEAVDATNQSQVQDLAALLWADAFMDNKRGEALVEEVETKLLQQGITSDKWDISVTDTGVTVTSKNTATALGLGSLISKDNYGDTVDYSVTVNGTTHDDWQIYYHNNDYVYLIAAEPVGNVSLDKGTTVASLTNAEKELYSKFQVGNGPKYTLVDSYDNSKAVAQLIKDYANFANTQAYGSNVVGAIGGPTIELLAAGWNAKVGNPTMTLTTDTYGYYINGESTIEVIGDGLYVMNYEYWLSSPSAVAYIPVMKVSTDAVNIYDIVMPNGVRPVVCLKASIPATTGTTTDFSLVK